MSQTKKSIYERAEELETKRKRLQEEINRARFYDKNDGKAKYLETLRDEIIEELEVLLK